MICICKVFGSGEQELRVAQKNGSRQQAVFPLALARTGEELIISGIRAGKGLSHKLMEQGIRPGAIVTIILKRGGGFILGYDGQRIALGAGMAQKLFVCLPAAQETAGTPVGGSSSISP